MVAADPQNMYFGGHSGGHVSGEAETGEEPPVKEKEIRSPSNFLVGLETLVPKVLQTAPIAMIQVADFVTDFLVILQLFEMGLRTTAMIATGCVIASIVPVVVGAAIAAISEFGEGRRRNGFVMLLVGLLGPINLHTLVLGLEYAVSNAAFQILKRGSVALAAQKAAQIARREAKWQEERVTAEHQQPIEDLEHRATTEFDGRIPRQEEKLRKQEQSVGEQEENVTKQKEKFEKQQEKVEGIEEELENLNGDKGIKDKKRILAKDEKKMSNLQGQEKSEVEHRVARFKQQLREFDEKVKNVEQSLAKGREKMSELKVRLSQEEKKKRKLDDQVSQSERDLKELNDEWYDVLKGIRKEIEYRNSKISAARKERASRTQGLEQATKMLKQSEPELFERKIWSERIHVLFMLSKAMESGMESLPLAVLSASVLISNSIEQDDYVLFVSSMVLSVLSMAYGFFGPCVVLQNDTDSSDNDDSELEKTEQTSPLQGHKLSIFLAILVNISWTVSAMAFCYGTVQLGAWRYLLPAFHFLHFFFVVAIALVLPLWASGNICFSGLAFFIFLPLLSLFIGSSVCASLVGAGTDLWRLLVPFDQREKTIEEMFEELMRPAAIDGIPITLTMLQRKSLNVAVFYFSPMLRRLSLWVIVGAALATAFNPLQAVLCVLGALADLTASLYLSSLFDHTLSAIDHDHHTLFDRFSLLFPARFRKLCQWLKQLCYKRGRGELEEPGSDDGNCQISGSIEFSGQADKDLGQTEEAGRRWSAKSLDQGTEASSAFIGEAQDDISIEIEGTFAFDVVQDTSAGKKGPREAGNVGWVDEQEGMEVSEDIASDAAERTKPASAMPVMQNSTAPDGNGRHVTTTVPIRDSNYSQVGIESASGGGSERGGNAEMLMLYVGDGGSSSGERASGAGAVTQRARNDEPSTAGPGTPTVTAADGTLPVLHELNQILQGLMCGVEPGEDREESDSPPRSKRVDKKKRETRYEQAEDDYLNAMSWHIKVATEQSASKDTATSHGKHKLLKQLEQQIVELQNTLRNPEVRVSDDVQRAIADAVRSYMPQAEDENVTSEQKLLDELKKLHGAVQSNGYRHEAPKAGAKIIPQPLHVTNLHFALQTKTWATVPSFFQKVSENCDFTQSYPAETCGYFISHSWQDDGLRKLSMLREFLFAHSFLGRICVVLPLLACFLLSTGFCLHSRWQWFPPFLLSGATMALLAVLLLWYWCSTIGLWPSSLAPWVFSTTTVWIDKLCIDQTNDETKMKGVASFKNVLQSTDRMVALISPKYFERVWCVYELAVFAKYKPDELLLLSLEWPSSLNIFASVDLTPDEEKMITTFSCKEAKCFVPADRVKVLEEIRYDFGSEDKFDEYVRDKLLEVLRESKRLYFTSVINAGKEAFDLAFGG